jgi:hypothetical protein
MNVCHWLTKFAVLGAAFALFSTGRAFCQGCLLQGVVRDVGTKAAISGADVKVNDGREHAAVTNASGQYTLTQLTCGSSVNAYYSRVGYVPYPDSEAVTLSRRSNTKDVALLRNTKDEGYWVTLSGNVKVEINASKPDTEQTIQEYRTVWSWLASTGISAPARGQAARAFLKTSPDSVAEPGIRAFASVDIDSLEKVDTDMRAAADGRGTLSQTYSVPAGVAASIAASVLKEPEADPAALAHFRAQFEDLWGTSAQQDLERKLSSSPTSTKFPL